MATDKEKALAAVQKAAERVETAQDGLAEARAAARQAAARAVAAGANLSEVGRILGISRQRVKQLVDAERGS